MVSAKEKLLEVFGEIQKEAKNDRFSSSLKDYVGHIIINGRIYEATITLEGDLDEMITDPHKENIVFLET
jgi:uncharacterized damage-inducible protein DinB